MPNETHNVLYGTVVDTEISSTEDEKEQHNSRISIPYKLFVVLGLIAIILLIIFRPCDCRCKHCVTHDASQSTTLGLDDNLDDEIPKNTASVDELNKKVQEGMITMSMNTDPIFESGTAKGNLLIENDTSNNYPIMVEIKTKTDGKTIYKSGLIPIGKFVNYARLSMNLEKGDYPCVAYFNNIESETGTILGTGGAEITIHVLG